MAAQAAASGKELLDGVTAVSSKVCDDYVRRKMPDGSFAPEAYAFGKGGVYGGSMRDETLDGVSFIDVAHVIAPALAGQNFVPASDPGKTRLLIMVYWGLTSAPDPVSGSAAYANLGSAQNALSDSASMSNAISNNLPTTRYVGFHSLASGSSGSTSGATDEQLAAYSEALTMIHLMNVERDRNNFSNALMLGYDSAGLVGTEHGNYVRGTAFGLKQADLVAEIEECRYFVVLLAYDFQLLLKQKKHKLLWEARFSVSERNNQFDKALPVMAKFASQYFGQPSNGLVRTRVPEGRVEIGETKSLGEVDEPKK
jgi:hypothetical protein